MAERMIQLRRDAGNALQKFFYELKQGDQTELETLIPNYKAISEIFLEDVRFDYYGNVDNVDWLEGEYSYPRMMKVLYIDEYAHSFIEGLIRSIASITEDTQKGALDELKKILENDEETLKIYPFIFYYKWSFHTSLIYRKHIFPYNTYKKNLHRA